MMGLAKDHICPIHRHRQQCGDGQREGWVGKWVVTNKEGGNGGICNSIISKKIHECGNRDFIGWSLKVPVVRPSGSWAYEVRMNGESGLSLQDVAYGKLPSLGYPSLMEVFFFLTTFL